MNKHIEALKMAIEAMNKVWDEADFVCLAKAINACKEALAEAESESNSQPVAWIEYKWEDEGNGLMYPVTYLHEYDNGNSKPLYTHPATWQSLSEDKIEYLECLKAPPVHPDFINDDSWYEFARAIEQALKELNAKK